MNSGRAKRKETFPILRQWGKIQNSLARITGLTFTTVGRDGKILAEGGENRLCRLLAESPRGKDLCRNSCLLEADKARRGKGVVHFRCQAGLQCFAVPILVEGSPVAATVGGRILDKAPDFSFFQDLARRVGLQPEEVLQAVGNLKLENVRTLSRVAEMVEQTGEILFAGAYPQSQFVRMWVSLGIVVALGGLSTGVWRAGGRMYLTSLLTKGYGIGGSVVLVGLLAPFSGSARAAGLAYNRVDDVSSVSMMTKSFARSVLPVAVLSTIKSASSGGKTSVAP